MEENGKIAFFHLNIHNYFIFKYCYLKIWLDTFKTMLFKMKINLMMDLPKKVFIWAYECLLFGTKTTWMLYRKIQGSNER